MNEDEKSGPNGPDRVGYGRPPKEHRFRKGKSGNPLGRPKVTRNLLERESSILFQKELSRKLTATGPSGERVTMTFLQAHYRNMCNRAMKGDRYAQKWVNDRIDREEADLMARRQQSYELICDIHLNGMKKIEEAQRQGLPEPNLLPDPRDIKIDPFTGNWSIEGPITAEDRTFYQSLVQARDAHLAELKKVIADMRCGAPRQDAQDVIDYASMVLRKANAILQGRYKLSDATISALLSEAADLLPRKRRSPRRLKKS